MIRFFYQRLFGKNFGNKMFFKMPTKNPSNMKIQPLLLGAQLRREFFAVFFLVRITFIFSFMGTFIKIANIYFASIYWTGSLKKWLGQI